MAVTVDSVIVELEARTAKFDRAMEISAAKAQRAFGKSIPSAALKAERQMLKSSTAISSTLRRLSGAFAAAFTGRELIGLVDSFTRFQNALKVTGLEGEKLAAVQERLLAVGGKYGVSLESLSKLFSNAAQSGKDLGVTQQQILGVTESAAQSLLITGTSAAQASGAILGLTQAFASGRVKAEEYNQINEGGLRPLLQAAAAAEEFGGSVGKLRNAIVEGEISSKRFFQLIEQGSSQLENQAAQATLTLEGAFTSLRNALTQYIGEAATAGGTVDNLSNAIKALADNLDTIIPALTIIAGIMGGRFLVSVVASSAALRALTAHIAIATTSMAGMGLAARSVGASMLAAFGGPVGLAVLAVGAALIYTTDQLRDADKASGEYAKQQETLRKAQERTTSATDALAAATGRARQEALANAKAVRQETIQYLANAKAALTAARAKAKEAAIEAQREVTVTKRVGGGLTRDQFGGTGIATSGPGERAARQAEINLAAANKAVVGFTAEVKKLDSFISAAPTVQTAAAGKASKARKGPADRSGQIAQRAADEANRLDQEILQAKLQLATNASDRADLEFQLLALEREQRVADIQNNKDLTADQRAAQLAVINSLYGVAQSNVDNGELVVRAQNGLFQQIIQQEALNQEIEDRANIARASFEAEKDALEEQLDRAVRQDERRAILTDLVNLEFKQREAALAQLIASEQTTEAEKQIAEIALARLQDAKAGQLERVNKDSAGPLEQFKNDLSDSAQTVDEQIEAIAVNGLKDFNSGLGEAILNGESLGDAFAEAGKRAVGALIDLAFQLLIIKPLVDSLSSSLDGDGGGFLGGLFSFLKPGRASGGNVSAGQTYQVNEQSGGSNPEFFQPSQSGSIIPLGRLPALARTNSGSNGGVANVRVTLSEDLDAKVEATSGRVAVDVVRQAAPSIVRASVSETFNQGGRPRL